ncbi:hypothetical protein BSIN_0943 [Burkholderia singularis]|uniref:Uncharacterized protein n=1 Tax=Burkholderia singularis TaxID=1503053 RepID=A0A238HBD8_9BURK|nr:hypothetical protein BSIN_0943 [Burkholderia singularis]
MRSASLPSGPQADGAHRRARGGTNLPASMRRAQYPQT